MASKCSVQNKRTEYDTSILRSLLAAESKAAEIKAALACFECRIQLKQSEWSGVDELVPI